MTRHRPPRLAAPLYIGVQRYFLTIYCHARRPHLQDRMICDLVLGQLARASKAEEIAVIAYCLMPDHLHLVAEGQTDAADCLEYVRLFKQTTAFAWKKHHEGRLWQDSFFDHVLRDTESTQRVVRYALENPVRARLVRYPWEYEHSGSLVHSREALFEWAFGTDRRALV